MASLIPSLKFLSEQVEEENNWNWLTQVYLETHPLNGGGDDRCFE